MTGLWTLPPPWTQTTRPPGLGPRTARAAHKRPQAALLSTAEMKNA
jgi:hypothetical protein